jgi:hypothetical protein
LRELSSVSAWRHRNWLDLLRLDRTVALQAVKIGVASALSWLVAHWAFGSPAPIYAPLTAAFVGLVTVQASVRDGIQRVIGVVVGIGVATFLVDVFGLHAWSIGIVVGLGYLVGKVLRLVPGAAAQIPVTGLLLLALGTASHPEERVLETLVGAAVAVLVNLVIIPPNHVGAARTAVRILADQVVDTLSDMAAGIAEPWTPAQAASWLRAARDGGGTSAKAQAAVDEAGQSLRLHPRRGDWEDVQAAVQHTARTLGVVEVQVRVIARTLRDTAENVGNASGDDRIGDGDAADDEAAGAASDETAGAAADEAAGAAADEAAGAATDEAAGAADSGARAGTVGGTAGAGARAAGTAVAGARGGGGDDGGRKGGVAGQPPMPMAADTLVSTAGAIDAFATGMLPTSGSGAAASLGTARAAIDAARARIAQINDDLGDLVAANLPRGIYLGTLVVETSRILDELDQGLTIGR